MASYEHKARSPKLITIEGCRNSRKGLGLRITGGRNRDRDEHFGIFVKEVIPGSLAATGGQLFVGDQLLEANGQSLVDVSNERAVEILKLCTATDSIKLLLSRDAAAQSQYRRLSDVLAETHSPLPSSTPKAHDSKRQRPSAGIGARFKLTDLEYALIHIGNTITPEIHEQFQKLDIDKKGKVVPSDFNALVDKIPELESVPRFNRRTFSFAETSPTPRITTQPKPVNTQYGSDAILSCRAEGLPGQVITYEWYKGEEKVPSGNSGDLKISKVTCEDEGEYHCVASCGSSKPVISDRVHLHMELDEADRIEITEHPQAEIEIEARVNETITLKCQAHNTFGKELDYQWFKDNKKVTGATGSEYKLNLNYKRHTTCKYYCRVSLKNCNGIFVKSKYAKVTVNMLWFTIPPQDFNGYVNEPVILYCQAEGLPGKKISYLWLKSSTPGAPHPHPVSEEDTLIIPSLRDSDCGYYTCQASEDSQFISSRSVSVTAKLRDGNEEKKPPVIRFIKQPRSWAVEVGKPFSLVCKAVASSGGVSYQWYKDGHMLPDQQSERLDRTATLDSFGLYYCVVKTTKAYGCDLSEAARVSLSIEDPVQNAQVHDAEKCYRIKEEEHFAQEKVALLIGNGDYNEMETLKAVESDIRNLHATLADKLGFKVISLMDLKYHEMLKALEQFYKYLQSGVYALFYFSGHGFNYNNTTYLMPIDARKDPLNCNECISSRTIQYRIQEKCAIGIALLDCCKVSGGRVASTSPADAPVGLSYSTYLEISACHDGFVAFADANGSMFNKALIPCLERKVKVNVLDLEILAEMRKMSQNSQRPHRNGTILHKDMTLHDPIMLSNGDAEKNIDSLSQQYSMANSVPGPIRLNVQVEPCVQFGLSFSAQFSNVLQVQIRPLAGNNISVTSVVIDKEFMKSQGVIATSDEVSGGIFSFKIKSIQGAAWPLNLSMKVTFSIGGQEHCVPCVHQFEEQFMFALLLKN